MAVEIASVFGDEPELIPGKAGIFDVKVDVDLNQQIVFSKHAEGRFPDHSEVIESLKGVQTAS